MQAVGRYCGGSRVVCTACSLSSTAGASLSPPCPLGDEPVGALGIKEEGAQWSHIQATSS